MSLPDRCRACGTEHELADVEVYDFDKEYCDQGQGVELFCRHCLTRYGLVCEEHSSLMVCAYDLKPGRGRDAIGMPVLFTCCRLCVDLAVRTIPHARAQQMLAYATNGDYGRYLVDFTERVADSELTNMTEIDKILYGLFMYVGLRGFTVTEYTIGRARTP